MFADSLQLTTACGSSGFPLLPASKYPLLQCLHDFAYHKHSQLKVHILNLTGYLENAHDNTICAVALRICPCGSES